MRDAPSRLALAVVAAAGAWTLPHPASAASFRPSAPGRGPRRRRIPTPTPTRDATDDDDVRRRRRYLSMTRDGGDRAASAPSPPRIPGVVFPGGGLFFYWQAGVVVSFLSPPATASGAIRRSSVIDVLPDPFVDPRDLLFSSLACAQAHLQERGYDLPSAPLAGASAGALSATLAKSDVSPVDATELALAMSEEAGIWDRPAGLQGIWGGIIREWLDVLLPEDAGEGEGARGDEEVRPRELSRRPFCCVRAIRVSWQNLRSRRVSCCSPYIHCVVRSSTFWSRPCHRLARVEYLDLRIGET